MDPNLIHNLASKYEAMYGTPFDLDEIEDNPLLDKNRVTHVRVVDVVGNIDPQYATYDCQGHVINDPWPTPFASCGFDLDAVGVIHDLAHYDVVEEKEITSVTIYPNPVQDQLSVDVPNVSHITLYSITGQCVAEADHNNVDVSSLLPGIYFAQVTVNGKTFVSKFVKK